jgi:hypothetical protein
MAIRIKAKNCEYKYHGITQEKIYYPVPIDGKKWMFKDDYGIFRSLGEFSSHGGWLKIFEEMKSNVKEHQIQIFN